MNRIKQLLGIGTANQDTDCAGDLPAEKTLELNFRNAPLETVLDHLSDTAGWFFRVKPNVDVKARVDLSGHGPVNEKDALHLLQQALNAKGCTAIRDGRMLTIIRSQDVKKSYIPIRLAQLTRPGDSAAAQNRLFMSPLPTS